MFEAVIVLCSALLSFGISLYVISLSRTRTWFIDRSDTDKPQRFHNRPVPRAGGIGIFIAFGAVLGYYKPLLFVPVAIVFISGIFEDFHNSLSPKIRLMLQSLAALCAVWLTDSVVTYLGLGITLPYGIGVAFSIFAMVGMINAVNIIDGFNGLASGIVLMILASLGYTAWIHHDALTWLIAGAFGATLGFFVLVFPKGRIFLGDGGAYLLGFIVAVFGIELAGRYDDVSPWYILALFIYPVWEVLFSILRKKAKGISPFEPDRYHFHMLIHRQVANRNNARTAWIILLLCFPFIVFTTAVSHCSVCNLNAAIAFIVLYNVIYVYLYRKDTRI